MEKIKGINVSDILSRFDREIDGETCGYIYYIDSNKILPWLKDFISRATFWETSNRPSIPYIMGSRVYWCGCLTAEPWCDLDMDEPDILDIILHDHTDVRKNENGEIVVEFVKNSKSELGKFFWHNRDGYGGNVSYSIESMYLRLADAIVKAVEYDLENGRGDKYGSWVKLEYDNEAEY